MTGKFVKQEEVDKFLKNIKEIVEKNKELKSELAKYKRAFEILKDTIDFNIFCREVKKGDGVEKTYFIIFGEIWIKTTKEQYELLEELMKGEDN